MKTSLERKNRGTRLGGLPGLVFNLKCGRQLPAPSATTTAVTAAIAAIPAASTSATSATSARSPTTAGPTAASTATITATSTASTTRPTATASTFTRGARFVDHNIATHEIMAVQSLNGAVGFFIAIDLHKSESAWLS
jgi:hypothetical protein